MRKNGTLSNKERANYARLIKRKLESVGVQDLIVMRPTKRYRLNVTSNEKGEPVINKVPMMQAQNLQRRVVRGLLNTNNPKTIQAFLDSDLSNMAPKKEEEPAQPSAE